MEKDARCNVASTVTEPRAIEGMELASLDASLDMWDMTACKVSAHILNNKRTAYFYILGVLYKLSVNYCVSRT